MQETLHLPDRNYEFLDYNSDSTINALIIRIILIEFDFSVCNFGLM